MWKWIVAAVGAAIAVAALAIFFIAQIEPQGFADFFIGFTDNVEVDLNGEKTTVRFSRLGEGVEPEDRAWVIRKMIAALGKSLLDPANVPDYEEYCRALIAAGEDKTLDREEFANLGDMISDTVSDEDVDNWLAIYEELEKKGKKFDIEEVIGD